MSQEPWYRGVPAIEAEVDVTEDATHRVAWRRGRFVLLDHPDPTGEMALVALGAESCPCFQIREAWRGVDRDVAWESTGWFRRGAEAWREYRAYRDRARRMGQGRGLIGVTMTTTTGGRSTSWGYSGSVRPPSSRPVLPAPSLFPLQREFEQRMQERLIQALPTPLLERLAFGMVVRGLRARGKVTEMALLRMREYAVGALTRCVRAWGPSRQRQAVVDVHIWPNDRVSPQVIGLVEHSVGYVTAVLPSRWLVAVQARGLGVVDGCFVLDAALVRGDHGTVEAVHFERTGPWGWTPVQRTMQVHRTRTSPPTWHLG